MREERRANWKIKNTKSIILLTFIKKSKYIIFNLKYRSENKLTKGELEKKFNDNEI